MLVLKLFSLIPLCIILYVFLFYMQHALIAQRKGLPPYIGTFRGERKLIKEKLKLTKGASMLDLGCGDGGMLRLFVTHFHLKRAVGVDINRFAIRLGRIFNTLYRHFSLGHASTISIKLVEGDIFKTDLHGYDYIYLYLYPDFIAHLEPRLFDNIDPKTIVICNTFHFVHHKPYETIKDHKGKDKIFLYHK